MKEKSDIYNTLAEIYFSSDSEGGMGKSDPVGKKRWMSFSILVNILLFLVLVVFLKMFFFRGQPVYEGMLEVRQSQRPIAVSFDFSSPNAPNTIVFDLPLEGVDATDYSKLVIPLRFNKGENHVVRLQVLNRFREAGEVPITGIDNHWHDFIINMKDLPHISSFKGLKNLKFFIDKWNINSNKGDLYIGNIRFIKGE